MTDKEIENDRSLERALGGMADECDNPLARGALDYINRLKTEIDLLKKNADEAFQLGLNEMRELVAPEIRKETAKEILQSIAYCKTVSNVRGKRYNLYELDQKDFENIADRFGVEVDDE